MSIMTLVKYFKLTSSENAELRNERNGTRKVKYKMAFLQVHTFDKQKRAMSQRLFANLVSYILALPLPNKVKFVITI